MRTRLVISLILIISLIYVEGYQNKSKRYTLTIDLPETGHVLISTSESEEPIHLERSSSMEFYAGTSVAVEAIGLTGYDLDYWDDNYSEENTLYLTIDEDVVLKPVFSKKSYVISMDKPIGGSIKVIPEIKAGKTYPAHTEFTIEAEASDGYMVDSTYYAIQGQWWTDYIEELDSKNHFTLRSDMRIGASFIPKEAEQGIEVIQNVHYAKPGRKSLKYDVYKPESAHKLPLVIVIHGGGWSSNDEDIMRGMAREITKSGNYVTATIDYRWIGHLDGDVRPNNMIDLINDVYGAIAHIMEYADSYGADPDRVAITGDSAGGHLSATAALLSHTIGQKSSPIKPSYLPKGKGIKEFGKEFSAALKVASASYGVFSGEMLGDYIMDLPEEFKTLVTPLENIPEQKNRAIPFFLVRGAEDGLIKEGEVRTFADRLVQFGQTIQYLEVEGVGHAFFDWKPDPQTQRTFRIYGIPYIEKMLRFFDEYL